jgi:phosphopantothenoylcysteine decarboxylase / phosphopantothenate---cysteine ligase
MNAMLTGKRVILGVTGSIAAVKAPILARELMRHGAEVICAMTEGAQHFTTATALAALTRNPVITSVFPQEKVAAEDAGTWHIHLARSADFMLIAPCSATMIGKLANGIYDDAVSLLTASLPQGTPLILAPAMDEEMWLQTVVRDNIEYLTEAGVIQIIQPIEGPLASGLFGKGRIKEPDAVVNEAVDLYLGSKAEKMLAGKRVLITGGPTYEPIDPVRFIGNRSSGKMAVALANAAKENAAEVTLIMGPSAIGTNGSITRHNVETAQEMYEAVMQHLESQDIIIMNAAVSDFAAETVSESKLKKRELESNDMSLKLRRTKDILSEVAKRKNPSQLLIGFALETGERAEAYALGKLEEKALDLIVLNRADESGAGFVHDTNKVTMFSKEGRRIDLELMSKERCAIEILREVKTIIDSRTKS